MLCRSCSVRLFTALHRGGPSASAAAPSLTRLNLEAVPLNAAVLAALVACTPRLSSLQLRGYELRRENGVSGRFVKLLTEGGDEASPGAGSSTSSSIHSSGARAAVGVPALLRHAAPSLHHLHLTDYNRHQLSALLAQCTRLESFSLDWQAPSGAFTGRARPSRPLLADLISVLTALGSLTSLELQFPQSHPNQPTELASAADAAEGRHVIPAGGLQRLRRLRLVNADPPGDVLGAALSRWLGPRPALAVLHLLSSTPGPADLRAISEIPGLKDLMVYSIVVPAAAEAGCGRGGGIASAVTAAPTSLQPGSLPLPPSLQRLGLWWISARALSALALPRSLTQLHLHGLNATDRTQQLVNGEAQEEDKLFMDWVKPASSDEAGQEDWSWRRVFQTLGRLRVHSAPPPPAAPLAGEGGKAETAAAATPLQRLHINVSTLRECDVQALVEELPQLQYLELECVPARLPILPQQVLLPLRGLAELRTLVLHPGTGRTWDDWLPEDADWCDLVEWPLRLLLEQCPRLTRLQLLLMDVYEDEEYDPDDPDAFTRENVEWATELEAAILAAVDSLRAATIPALQRQEGPRQGAEVVVEVQVADFDWMEAEGLRASGL
ncbi:hypothetical protein HXX76_014906 [Chlamydomonas incerta]|uniref:Uncharacterized protein n=1 Tax=Chlamydomonas incerta TaxID=51695 RepID=A0A835SAZ8_CHLIN|nr:hypothetical protein HXX76_014906 [Chlamydomonas incerta]|eukprot:KAG2423967.1 hypothetical protein HXX76_014906 [Chlamydomonas incerta]